MLTANNERFRSYFKWHDTTVIRLCLMLLALTLLVPLDVSAKQKSVGLPNTIYIASGETGSLQNTVATGVAKVLSDALDTNVVVRPYSGTTSFFSVVNRGDIYFAVAPSVDFALSYQGPDSLKIGGRNPYPDTPNVRLVSSGALLMAGMLVRDESSINNVEDLEGKTLAGGFPTHLGAYINTYAHILSAGLDWDDVDVIETAGLNQGMDLLKAGRVDGTVYGVGSPGVKQANARRKVRFISDDCSAPAKQRVHSEIPGYYLVDVPKGKFTGVLSDICITAYPLYLVTSTEVPSRVVAAVTAALYQNASELAKYNPVLKTWTRNGMVDTSMTIPYDNAAVEFFKSVDAWTAKADEKQNVLLQ